MRYPEAHLQYMEPAEWDSRKRLEGVCQAYPTRVEFCTNRFFLGQPADWGEKIRKGTRMEYFYREMRRRTGFLMDGDKPVGGAWNFDKENRKKLPKNY
ncbi:cryptochrome/photolyase family protein, partial [Arthrospira platensis SPKY1]|nr:cryptochrome/photolyase family protein [Arthrospira platensis SPKY1]